MIIHQFHTYFSCDVFCCTLGFVILLAVTSCSNQSDDHTPVTSTAVTATTQQEALLDCAVLPGNRLVGVGHSQNGVKPQLAVLSFNSSGALLFEKTFPLPGVKDSAGIGTSLQVDSQNTIYVGGSQFLGQESRGIVLALTDRGDLLWESVLIARGRSGVNALAYDTSGLYVTGWAQTPGGSGEPNRQAIFLAKLDLLTGAVLWQTLIENNSDPFEISAGLSLDVGPSGRVAVAGVSYQSASGADWFVGVWGADGQPIWQDIHAGSGSRLDAIGEPPDVAWKGRFDIHGDLYVVGRLYVDDHGADISVVKYSSRGEVLWEFTRHEEIHTRRADSFDEAKHIAVGVDQLWVSGTVTREGASGVVSEGIVLSLSSDGTLLWEQNLSESSLSGEDIGSIAVDSEGNAYYGGMASSVSIGKDMIVEKIDRRGTKLWSIVLELPGADHLDLDRIHCVSWGGGDKLSAVGSLQLEDGRQGHVAVQLDRDGRLQWAFPTGVVAMGTP